MFFSLLETRSSVSGSGQQKSPHPSFFFPSPLVFFNITPSSPSQGGVFAPPSPLDSLPIFSLFLNRLISHLVQKKKIQVKYKH